MERHEILGLPVNALTYHDAVSRVEDSITTDKPTWILAMNPEKIMKAIADAELSHLLKQADLFIPDGVGILWAGKIFGMTFPQRVTGVDLLMTLIEEAARRGWRIYLLGAAPGVVEEVARSWENAFPGLQVAGCHDGYFGSSGEDLLAEKIKQAKPDILFVGMGSPKQEKFINTYQARIGVPVCMGVGGSFDVISGKKKRAPQWMQNSGLEWSYRFFIEPTRILRMSALPKFMLLVLRKKLGLLRLEGDKE